MLYKFHNKPFKLRSEPDGINKCLSLYIWTLPLALNQQKYLFGPIQYIIRAYKSQKKEPSKYCKT